MQLSSKYLKDFVFKLYGEDIRQLKFAGKSKEEFYLWQDKSRQKLREILNISETKKPENCLKRKSISENENYTIHQITYFSTKNLAISGFLLIPKKVSFPVPAILCPLGHWGSARNIVLDNNKNYPQYPFNRYPIELVKRGFVVLVQSNLSFDGRGVNIDKNNEEEIRTNHQYLYLSLNLLGKSLLGIMIWDLVRAVDVLQSLPEVKPESLGCYGLSLGGELTLFLTALDNRISAACCSGFLSSYRDSYLSHNHCGCGYSYGLLKYFEHVDIAAMIAPRSFMVETGKKDEWFPLSAAVKTFKELRKIYMLFNEESRVVHDIFEGSHEISGQKSYDWFSEVLI